MLLAEARLLAAPPAAARSSGAPASDSASTAAPATAGQQPPAHAAGLGIGGRAGDALADEAALRRAFAGVLAENGQLHLRVNAALRAQLKQRPEGAPQPHAGPRSTSISGAKESAAPDADGTGIPRGSLEPGADTKAKAGKAVDEKAGPSLAGALFSRLVAFGAGGDAGGGGQLPGGGAAGALVSPKPAQNPTPAPALAARSSATSALARGAGWAAGWVGSSRTGSGPAAPKPGQSPSAAAVQGDADRGMLRAPSGALEGSTGTGTPLAIAASGQHAQPKGSRTPGTQPARQGPGAGVRPKAQPAAQAASGPAAGSAAASGARGDSAPVRCVPPVQVGVRQPTPGPQGATTASDLGPGLSPVSDAGNAPPAGEPPLLDFSGLTVFGAGGPGQGPDVNPGPPGGAQPREADPLDAWAAGVGGGGALLGEAKGGVEQAGSAASGHGMPANGQLAARLRELDGQQSLI